MHLFAFGKYINLTQGVRDKSVVIASILSDVWYYIEYEYSKNTLQYIVIIILYWVMCSVQVHSPRWQTAAYKHILTSGIARSFMQNSNITINAEIMRIYETSSHGGFSIKK